MMELKFMELCPFICELADLEVLELNFILKRQVIARFPQYKQGENSLSNYEKSVIKVDKTIVKISYNDIKLLYELSTQFMQSIQKFSNF
jgi:hypothetical protein